MFRMKSVVGAIAVAAMVSTSAFAASTDGALAPGKPAGVQKAEIGTGTLLLGLFGVALVTAVAIVVSNQSGDRSAPTTFTPATTAP
jgi:hypothetical protein